jgi:DNA-binding MarR family transcriptional regulator
MMALHRAGPPHALRPSEILKTHGVTSGTVTYRIDQLTNQGLAERLADPTDRRGYLIQLTPRGKKLIETVLDQFARTYNTLLVPFAHVAGGHDVLESGLRFFEGCINDRTKDLY